MNSEVMDSEFMDSEVMDEVVDAPVGGSAGAGLDPPDRPA
jgi:hypothetical protein